MRPARDEQGIEHGIEQDIIASESPVACEHSDAKQSSFPNLDGQLAIYNISKEYLNKLPQWRQR